MKSVFTTSGVPPNQRVDMWQDFVSSSFAPVRVVGFKPKYFEANINAFQIGDLDVAHFTGVEQGICRPQQMIRSSDADMFVAVVQLGGALSYRQASEEKRTMTGSVTLFDMTQEYRTMFHDGMDFLDVSIPRKRLEAMLGSTRNLAGITIGPEQPITQIIIEFFRNQMLVADRLSTEAACRLGTIGADLLAAGLLEKIGGCPGHSVGGAACMARAKTFIRTSLGNENLSPEMVARSQNLSLRRMQELFAEEMLTISDYIWEERLVRARNILKTPAFNRLTVEGVARFVGFVSSPHFSRRFRARFGCSPLEWRQGAGQ